MMMERFTEHRASSSNDAWLFKNILEKAKEGTTTEPYFVADIVEGSLQTSTLPKLGLPAAFLEHHGKNLTENIILEGSDGHKWPVKLGMSWDPACQFKPCLLQGWGEFATDCNLAVNDQILVFLRKDSHLLVHVFDSNHNIKRKGGGTSAHIARTILPQVTDPVESIGFKTTTPNLLSLPRANNNAGVAKNVPKGNHTTQASPSGEKLGNQEPGVEEDDDRVSDFNAKSGEMVESFQSAPPSDAEEDQALSMERARNLNPNTMLLGVAVPYESVFDPPGSHVTIHDDVIKAAVSVPETARSPVRRGKEPKFIEEIIPKKRARQAPTDRSQSVSASTSRTRQARGTMTTTPDNSDDPSYSRATKSAPHRWNTLSARRFGGATAVALDAAFAAETAKAREAFAADTAKAREAAKAAANKEGEATARAPAPVRASNPVTPMPAPVPVRASNPVTPMPVEAPRIFIRPQPRNPPRSRQLFFSKRRPVTQQERQAALEAGQRYATASYNGTHVIQLSVLQVYFGNFLDMSTDFAEAMELPMKRNKKVILYDVTGRQWQATWHGDPPKRFGLDSAGWSAFAMDHYLEEGDVIVFELPDPKVCNIAVTVFPVVPVTPARTGWLHHYSVNEPVVPVVVPAVVTAVVQPEADVGLTVQATLPGQSSSFEKEDTGTEEGKRRRFTIDLNSREEDMNKSCEKDKSSEKGEGCMEETSTEGNNKGKSVE